MGHLPEPSRRFQTPPDDDEDGDQRPEAAAAEGDPLARWMQNWRRDVAAFEGRTEDDELDDDQAVEG